MILLVVVDKTVGSFFGGLALIDFLLHTTTNTKNYHTIHKIIPLTGKHEVADSRSSPLEHY